MATTTTIGVELPPDEMILTRGRDFRWTFENLDDVNEPENFPDGRLYFELQTGGQHNAEQTIVITGANDGFYTLTLDAETTSTIAYDVKAPALQEALEDLPNVGDGNVTVSAGTYTPQWIFTAEFDIPLSDTIVEGINTAVNTIFDLVEGLTGIELDFFYDPPFLVITVTAQTSLTEQGLLTFIVDTLAEALEDAINELDELGGEEVVTFEEFYAPIRTFAVEFVEDLAETPVSELVPDTGLLDGYNQTIEVTVDEPGKAELTIWEFDIVDTLAQIKVEHPDADLIQARTQWQLVWLADAEPAGGDALTRGRVRIQE